MFTGLVEEVGKVRSTSSRQGNRILEVAAKFSPRLATGDSVAVNGCCLTVVERTDRSFKVEAVAATLKATTLETLRSGAAVNLERAMAVGDRFGGHIVQGHIDEVAQVARVERLAGSWQVRFRTAGENRRLLVEHGSICVDGVSLTVAALARDGFAVNIIPHTWENTALPGLRAGDRANVEYDLIAKSIARILDKTSHV
jgi:riboflavin synthase